MSWTRLGVALDLALDFRVLGSGPFGGNCFGFTLQEFFALEESKGRELNLNRLKGMLEGRLTGMDCCRRVELNVKIIGGQVIGNLELKMPFEAFNGLPLSPVTLVGIVH